MRVARRHRELDLSHAPRDVRVRDAIEGRHRKRIAQRQRGGNRHRGDERRPHEAHRVEPHGHVSSGDVHELVPAPHEPRHDVGHERQGVLGLGLPQRERLVLRVRRPRLVVEVRERRGGDAARRLERGVAPVRRQRERDDARDFTRGDALNLPVVAVAHGRGDRPDRAVTASHSRVDARQRRARETARVHSRDRAARRGTERRGQPGDFARGRFAVRAEVLRRRVHGTQGRLLHDGDPGHGHRRRYLAPGHDARDDVRGRGHEPRRRGSNRRFEHARDEPRHRRRRGRVYQRPRVRVLRRDLDVHVHELVSLRRERLLVRRRVDAAVQQRPPAARHQLRSGDVHGTRRARGRRAHDA
mmetsp:Transcript_7522/g.27473  ORF Transcript_7522/g.27473 Transcript_7522/m.27473 type:complete len:357 (-) Transcript_7522:120-1190(-)|eukprot:31176-Pelagococcus_subviridis.AAC.65